MTIEIHLKPQHEKVAAICPYDLKQGHMPLYHQMRTVEALKQSPLVMNTYNTGTGKTLASLFYLFEMAKSERLSSHTDNVLFIAPTNELLHQHAEDIRSFVANNELPFRVIEVNAQRLRALSHEDIPNRQGERLTRLIADPRTFFEELGLAPDESRKPSILVTNPDLFYYALYWRFAGADQRNLFMTFANRFRYVVIDEFHYYNSKQLANFLFFIVLSREWQHFERRSRRICLLSATPNASTVTYLNRVLDKDEDGWALVSPDNEPAEAANLSTIPVLAPTRLCIEASDGIQNYAKDNSALVKQWIHQGLHGAMISSALWRINAARLALRGVFADEQVGRITGAQSVELRREDQFKDLILATPTVDIGFNFLKLNKERQNLDFVVFDSRFRDEFTQRLGRAGRVLGKPATDQPSIAVALVSESVTRELASLDGQTMTREELNSHLTQLESLPEKDDFTAYLKAGGLLENAYPIYRSREMMETDSFAQLEELYEAVRAIFAPQSRYPFSMIQSEFRMEGAIAAWLRGDDFGRQHLPKVFTEYTEWLMGTGQERSPAELEKYLREPSIKSSFTTYCEMRQALMQARFTFRDSFGGAVAWAYDPDHLLSDADISQYDLLHLVENYEISVLSAEDIKPFFDELPPKNAISVQLRRQRSPERRQYVGLKWSPPPHLQPKRGEETFFRSFVGGKPIAAKGLVLVAGEPLDPQIGRCLVEQYVPMLLVPTETSIEGRLRRAISRRQIYTRDVAVKIPGRDLRFKALLGTDALLMEPLLKWRFSEWAKERDTAIIC